MVFPQNSDPFLASSVAVEKPEAILLPDFLCVIFFLISPLTSFFLKVCKLFFFVLSILKCSVNGMEHYLAKGHTPSKCWMDT